MAQYQETNTLLKVEGVHLTLGENHILHGVDLEIKDIVQEGRVRGQIRGIIGPSGIGKTQLLRTIAGLQEPDQGSVEIAPDGVHLQPVRPGMVGVVAQDYPLFDHLTVLENLVLAAKQSGITTKEAKEKARDLLSRFGLHDREHFWPSQLSGGQRQRVSILQQTIEGRLFLIMDEPFSGLDPRALREVIGLVQELSGAHEFNTIMIITHDIRAAVQVSERIHVLGRDLDAQGNILRGAHFIRELDLLEMNIAWQDDIRALPRFNETVNEIEDLFSRI